MKLLLLLVLFISGCEFKINFEYNKPSTINTKENQFRDIPAEEINKLLEPFEDDIFIGNG